MTKVFGLPRSSRLITQRDFRRVYRRGARAHGKSLVVVALPRREAGCRVGLSVSKEHGSAVRRNKLKRILREAFRLERPGVDADLDVILIPQKRERYALADVREELVRLLAQVLAARAPRRRR